MYFLNVLSCEVCYPDQTTTEGVFLGEYDVSYFEIVAIDYNSFPSSFEIIVLGIFTINH